jgi:hypothetical protein
MKDLRQQSTSICRSSEARGSVDAEDFHGDTTAALAIAEGQPCGVIREKDNLRIKKMNSCSRSRRILRNVRSQSALEKKSGDGKAAEPCRNFAKS